MMASEGAAQTPRRSQELATRDELGRMVMNGEILTYEQALATGYPIREVEIVDALLPEMEDDVLSVNMIQRMTDSEGESGSMCSAR